MTWLTPLTGLLLAAAVIPPLIVLYFLKLRRRTTPIASTLLWKRAVEDLRANAPFQKLRRSILLLLQLLALILLALAVTQPQLQAGQGAGGKTVLLIDHSASMSATDGPEGAMRLDAAKRQARERIEQLHAGGLLSRSPGETMVVAFSDRAEILSRFTSSKQQLLAAVDAVGPTHGQTKLAEALKLARAYTTNVDPENPRAVGEAAALELYSDGRIADLGEQVLRGERMIFHPIGTAEADNVAIATLTVQRPYDQPTAVQVFVSLLNFNAFEVSCPLQLSVNGDVRAGGLEDLRIDPATRDAKGALAPGRYNLTFKPFEQPRDAVIEIRNLRPDHLEADNAAIVVVPPARKLRVALVASKSFVLRLALEGLALERLDLIPAARFDELAASAAGRAATELDGYDVIVLDNHAPPALPPGRYLGFGATPPLEGLNEYGVRAETQLILDSRDDHPLLSYVDLSDVLFSGAHLLQPADDVVEIAEASSGAPAIIEINRGRVHVIHATFDLLDSSFPIDRSFPTFMFNAVDYLGHAGDALTSQSFVPGEALTATLPASATAVEMLPPGGPAEDLALPESGAISWGPARLAGLHMLSWSMPGETDRQQRALAVNLVGDVEGDLASAAQISVSQDVIEGQRAKDSAYTSLWPWAIGVCLAVLMLEWWIYHRKVYV
jgi:hypothetical protein